MLWVRTLWSTALICAFATAHGWGAAFGVVRGIVHDPQHRPVPGATVTIQGAYRRLAADDHHEHER